jgi:GNAT superfamily N-acetyltransferase
MPSAPAAYPFADLSLARRLERAEGTANAASVEARARLWPERGAAWIDVRGAYAMFDGIDSPLTQTFGLGLFADVTPADLDAIERFFGERGAPSFHEVCPLATSNAFTLLGDRGYRPFEFTSVMFRPVPPVDGAARSTSLVVRVARHDEEDAWARTAAAGWSESRAVESFMRDIGRLSMARADTACFVAEWGGEPIATGMLSFHEGVALFAGASTVPEYRGRGAQLALLDARLRCATERGCDLAMMCAAPGSASQRNAERNGFRIAYTRMKFRRPTSAA